MGHRTALMPGTGDADAEAARRAKRENRAQRQRLLAGLPRHRELIAKIVEHGLQPV